MDKIAQDRRRHLREKIEKYNTDSRYKYELQWFHSYVVEGLLNDCDKLEKANSNLQSIVNELSEDLKLALTQYEESYNRVAQERDKLYKCIRSMVKSIEDTIQHDIDWNKSENIIYCPVCRLNICTPYKNMDDNHYSNCAYIFGKKLLESA